MQRGSGQWTGHLQHCLYDYTRYYTRLLYVSIIMCMIHELITLLTASFFHKGLTTAPIRFTNASYKYGIELTWSPPFTLPGTEMEFIVEATIATDSLLRLLTSQTHQNVSYSDLNISRCDSNQTVHFSVRGVNEVGEGEAASIILHLTPAESVCDNSEITLTQGICNYV